jgi:hypothetical protein
MPKQFLTTPLIELCGKLCKMKQKVTCDAAINYIFCSQAQLMMTANAVISLPALATLTNFKKFLLENLQRNPWP